MENSWGLLGPELLPKTRRTRTLGLGAAVRTFNDLAVPGLGGVWYGKRLLLATLGIIVAEEARKRGTNVSNINVANAIEAVACWLSFKEEKDKDFSDSRLRGKIKLQGKEDLSFSAVNRKNFYVVQPMRMATVQALPALGFVSTQSSRFNNFVSSDEGRDFVEEATKGSRPYNRTVIEHLTRWVCKQEDKVNSPELYHALSPLVPLSKDATVLLNERLKQGGKIEGTDEKVRRNNALAWVKTLASKLHKLPNKITWEQKPDEITEEHWKDLHAGAVFFETREAAIEVLDALEAYIGNLAKSNYFSFYAPPDKAELEDVFNKIETLQGLATRYLHFEHTNTDADSFCNECIQENYLDVLQSLVKRDGVVLMLDEDRVKAGPAFQGVINTSSPIYSITDENDEENSLQSQTIPIPEGISYRVRNLYLLNLDMQGNLGEWLQQKNVGGDE